MFCAFSSTDEEILQEKIVSPLEAYVRLSQ